MDAPQNPQAPGASPPSAGTAARQRGGSDVALLVAVVLLLVVVVVALYARSHRGKEQHGGPAFGRHRTHRGEPGDFYSHYLRPGPQTGSRVGPGYFRRDPWDSWCWCECPAGNAVPDGTTGRLCRCPCV